jgi:hypothetical protein
MLYGSVTRVSDDPPSEFPAPLTPSTLLGWELFALAAEDGLGVGHLPFDAASHVVNPKRVRRVVAGRGTQERDP